MGYRVGRVYTRAAELTWSELRLVAECRMNLKVVSGLARPCTHENRARREQIST